MAYPIISSLKIVECCQLISSNFVDLYLTLNLTLITMGCFSTRRNRHVYVFLILKKINHLKIIVIVVKLEGVVMNWLKEQSLFFLDNWTDVFTFITQRKHLHIVSKCKSNNKQSSTSYIFQSFLFMVLSFITCYWDIIDNTTITLVSGVHHNDLISD